MVLSMFYESKCALYVAECASINSQAQRNMFSFSSRQCGKPESGRNVAEGCHSQQQALAGWIAKLCLLQTMLRAKVHPF